MWAGSVTDILKIRLRHEWHILCEHGNFAVRETDTSSPQVRQETFFSGNDGFDANNPPKTLEFLFVSVVVDRAVETAVFARRAASSVSSVGRVDSDVAVALFRSCGRVADDILI